MRGGTDEVYFVQNLYVSQTNVCRVKCKFCAFAATRKQEHAYTLTTEELVADVLAQREITGFTELHMVNGESPHVDFDFYRHTIASLHEALPDVHLKCYTASEIHHMTTLSGLTHEEVLRELTGGGAGLAAGWRGGGLRGPRAPARRAGQGVPGDLVPRARHRASDGNADALHHALRARRDLRGARRPPPAPPRPAGPDRGFLAFIPLAFHPENTVFERRGWRHTTGSDDLKMLAFSRLMLDNVENIKAYWIMMGMPLAAVALHFGANDVQGTVVREQIFHAAGARTETEQKIDELVRFVRDAGRIPVQRDTLYRELRRW